MIAKKQIISPHLFSEKKKKQYFAKLNEKKITNKRTFWQTVKQFLSDKNKSREKITLLKNEETTSDEVEVANTLNSFFSNTVKNLKIPEKIPLKEFLDVFQVFIFRQLIKILLLNKLEN